MYQRILIFLWKNKRSNFEGWNFCSSHILLLSYINRIFIHIYSLLWIQIATCCSIWPQGEREKERVRKRIDVLPFAFAKFFLEKMKNYILTIEISACSLYLLTQAEYWYIYRYIYILYYESQLSPAVHSDCIEGEKKEREIGLAFFHLHSRIYFLKKWKIIFWWLKFLLARILYFFARTEYWYIYILHCETRLPPAVHFDRIKGRRKRERERKRKRNERSFICIREIYILYFLKAHKN